MQSEGQKLFADYVRHKMKMAEQAIRPAPTPERDARDYAIEFGGYLAEAARTFQVAVNSGDEGQRNEAWRALNSAIYEFEKRARRAQR